MPNQTVITRFAPSPTGFLHIGGARTALFNWLFAKHTGGEFHLRIEDTDRARSTPEATQAILDGLAWLGLHHDGDIVYQSQNMDDHVKAVYKMLENGTAYRCYCSPEELETLREKARKNGTAFRSPWRTETKLLDQPYTVRFRVPDGDTAIEDHVQGEVNWDNKNFDDLVLLRADGTPTYMLAVVVDDHDMGITHVIRGDDHLINAGRQTLIYQALDWAVPEWAHVPLIHGPDGKKLSKRHGALGVEAYREMGYLPSGLQNYLLKLGWAHGDDEIFLGDDAVKVFTLDGINASPARLDFDKMDYINQQHLIAEPAGSLMAQAKPFLENINGGPLSPERIGRVDAALETLRPRSKTLKELAEQAAYLLMSRPIDISEKAKKALKNDALTRLRALTLRLEALEDDAWVSDNIQACLQSFAADNDIGFGKVGQPLRAALTGGAPSPDLSWVLALLGKSETLARLSDVMASETQY